MNGWLRIAAAATVAGAMTAMSPLPAQQTTQMPAKGSMTGKMHGGMMTEHRHMMSPEEHLKRLKSELQITQKQMPAWNDFAKSVQQIFHGAMRRAPTARSQGLTPAPEVLREHARRMSDMAQKIKDSSQALSKLYDQLTEKQRTILDTKVADMMRHHMRGHYAMHSH